MKKTGLQDMKKRNRRVVLEAILRAGRISRIELAAATELSPSTVSGLVGELVEEGLLAETGAASTAGRPRVELGINPGYGLLAVLEIGRDGSSLHLFDMALGRLSTEQVTRGYVAGNDLLAAVCGALDERLKGPDAPRLAGAGLLFQEDMQSGEFNVVYSTSLSSASISLREALFTQYRVPVCEDYSQVHSMAGALSALGREEAPDSLHLSLGERVLATVVLGGAPVRLRGGVRADAEPLLLAAARDLPELPPEDAAALAAEAGDASVDLARGLASVVATFCRIFALDVVFLSGGPARAPSFAEAVEDMARRILDPLPAPAFESEAPARSGPAESMALKVRTEVLSA